MNAAKVVDHALVAGNSLAEEIYHILFQQTTDGILLIDPQGQVVDVNQQAGRLLGYLPAELITQPLTTLDPPPDRFHQPPLLAKLQQNQAGRSKHCLLRKDKMLVTVEIRTQQLSDERFLAILHDLTDHEMVETILRENEEWLQLAHEAAELGSWRLHLQAHKIYLDERARSHYGLAEEVFSTAEWLAHVHPADRALVREQGNTLLSPTGGSRQRIEHRVIDDDGTVRWLLVQARAYFNRDGEAQQPLMIAGISQDITPQKQLELQLQARNRQLALLAELSHVLAQSTQDYQALPQLAIRQIATAFQSGCLIRLLTSTGEWLPLTFFDPDPAAIEFVQLLLPALPMTSNEPSLSAYILQQRQPIFMPQMDLGQLRSVIRPEFWPLLDQVPVQSIMATALRVRDQAIGILYLWRLQPDAQLFTEQDLQLLQDVADRTALAIGNARLYHELQNELTQRLQAEQALRASEQRYRTLIDALPIAVYTTDVDGHITLYNAAAAKLWDCQPRLGLDYWAAGWQFYSRTGQVMTPAQCPLLVAMREARPLFGQELIAIRPDQRRLALAAYPTPLYDDQGQLTGGLNVLVDITDRKAAEDALRVEEERLAKLAATIPGVIYIFRLGPDGVLSAPYCSPGIEEVLGITAAELRADIRPLFARMHPDDVAQTVAMLQQNETKLAPSYLEFRFHHPERGEIWVAAHSSPERTADGNVLWYGFATNITEHKQAQEQVHYQAMLLANVNDAVIATDLAFRITSWNKGAEQLYDWRAAEVIGQPLHRILLHTIDDQHPFGTLLQYLLVHEVWSGEATHQRKGGAELCTLGTVSLVKDLAGKAIGTIGVIRDITAAKAAEAALRASEDRFNKAFRASAAALVMSNAHTSCIVDVNESFLQLTGLAHDEVIGAKWYELNAFVEGTAEINRLLREEGALHQWETIIHNRYGERRHLVLSIEYFESAGELMLLTIAFDVTTHKQAEERLQIALAAARMGVWEWEVQHDQIFWSPECTNIFGILPRKLSRAEFATLIHPEDAQRTNQEFESALRNQSLYRDEFRIVRADGEVRWVNNLGKGTYNEQGQLIRVVGTVQDITERKQTEAERTELEEQLHQAQKMETIGRLAGGVAHDFNNLLTVIQGYSDMLLAQVTPDSPLFGKLDQISRAGKRAADLTGQLLAFSRRQMLTPTDVDLNQIINNLKRMLGRLIGEDILLVTVLHPNLWIVTVDGSRIEQVIMNLVVNARDAMPQGGVLTIETTNVFLEPGAASSDHGALTGACIRLTVSDTGYGMDELVRSQIFEPFFTTKEQGKGTGLGLSMVYGIIKQSGGDITVTSEPAVGSQFNLYLPAKHGTSQSGTSAELGGPPMKGNETILLVEDEEMVRDLVQFTLEEAGYAVLAARAGSEAITLATQHQGMIALLMTDVVMPQMSGRELAEYFQRSYPHTKVLFTSGYTDDAVVRHGLLTAEVAFIQKPFAPHALLTKIRNILDGAG